MLTSGDPGLFLNQASTVLEINDQAGMRLTNLQKMQIASQRAQATAQEEIATVNQLQGQINGKVKAIQSKLDILNSSAMAQAMAIFDQTGSYPDVILPEATNVGHDGAARRADPARQALCMGSGGPGLLRLLGAGCLGLRPGRHLAAALHRIAVELRHARVP